jgi:hypothetical protein
MRRDAGCRLDFDLGFVSGSSFFLSSPSKVANSLLLRGAPFCARKGSSGSLCPRGKGHFYAEIEDARAT